MHDRLAALAGRPPIDPLTVVPQHIVLSSQHHAWHGITVWRSQTPPVKMYEIVVPPVTKHAILLQLNAGSHFIQERAIGCHKGPRHPGDMTIVHAGQPSGWRAQGPVDNLHIDIEPGFLQRVALEACGMPPHQVELLDVFLTRDPVMQYMALALLAELETEGLGGRLYAESLANVLAVHLLRTYCAWQPVLPSCKGGLPRHALQRVTEYIHVHLADPIALSHLAALVQMSQYHFLRAFKQAIGLTPHQYVIQCRIERAKSLLRDTTWPINTIAGHVGWQTQSHFARLFRVQTGVTPKTYRALQAPRRALHSVPAGVS